MKPEALEMDFFGLVWTLIVRKDRIQNVISSVLEIPALMKRKAQASASCGVADTLDIISSVYVWLARCGFIATVDIIPSGLCPGCMLQLTPRWRGVRFLEWRYGR